MDFSVWLAASAWLPAPQWMHWAMPVSWALVLGTMAAWLCRPMKASIGRLIVLAVVVCTLLPGPLSPAYWLGLAFQSPSLMSVVLCVAWWLRHGQWSKLQSTASMTNSELPSVIRLTAWHVLWGNGVLLGWVLLVDMLAGWPVSVYAFGFGPAALALACMLTAFLWIFGGVSPSARAASGVLGSVLILFAVTRLPSGNVWDALLDPWLWLGLQVTGLQRVGHWGWCRFRGRCGAPTTHV